MASSGLAAGSAWSIERGAGDVFLAAAGGALGMALVPLFAWGVSDMAVRRIGPLAAAVAGSWIAAFGIIAAALAV